MGTIAIAVDGNHVFNWQGDVAEAKHIIEEFPRGAHHVGMTPDPWGEHDFGSFKILDTVYYWKIDCAFISFSSLLRSTFQLRSKIFHDPSP
jgi:hypothetical protein